MTSYDKIFLPLVSLAPLVDRSITGSYNVADVHVRTQNLASQRCCLVFVGDFVGNFSLSKLFKKLTIFLSQDIYCLFL